MADGEAKAGRLWRFPNSVAVSTGRPSARTIITAVLVAAAVAFFGWVLLVDDPDGGEPVAVLPLGGAAGPQTSGDGTAPPSSGQLRSSVENADTGEVSDGRPLPTRIMPTSGAVIREIGDDGRPVTIASADAALTERGPHGAIPRIAEDGRMPAKIYARPAPNLADGAPRIAIVLGGLGLSVSATEDAVRRLPGTISLAFAPYGRDLARITSNAAQDGHELLLQIPLEPFDYPDNDPGPHTLLTSLPERQNIDRLHWVMSRFIGYAGVMGYMGARFVTAERALEPILTDVRDRGLIYVDDGSVPQTAVPAISDRLGLMNTRADVVIDATPRRDDIDRALSELEALALNRGHAIGVADALPVTVQALEAWIRDIERRGIVLVPLTSIAFDNR